MIKLFVKMLHIRTGKLITVREVKIQNLLFDEFKSLDLKLSLLLYRITKSMVRLEHNRHVSPCTHQQHIFTTWMTVEEFTNIVHLKKKNK